MAVIGVLVGNESKRHTGLRKTCHLVYSRPNVDDVSRRGRHVSLEILIGEQAKYTVTAKAYDRPRTCRG